MTIVNRQIRTKFLGLKEYLGRKRGIKNDEFNKEQAAERLHEVSEDDNKESGRTSITSSVEEVVERSEKEKELVDANRAVATEEESNR